MWPRLELLLDKFRKNKLDVPEMDVLANSIWMVEDIIASNDNRYIYFTLNNDKYMDVIQYLLHKNGIRVSKHTTYKDYTKCKVLRVLVGSLTPQNIEFINKIKNMDLKLSVQKNNEYLQKIMNRSWINQR